MLSLPEDNNGRMHEDACADRRHLTVHLFPFLFWLQTLQEITFVQAGLKRILIEGIDKETFFSFFSFIAFPVIPWIVLELAFFSIGSREKRIHAVLTNTGEALPQRRKKGHNLYGEEKTGSNGEDYHRDSISLTP